MFSWAGIISGVVSIINKVTTYFTNKQLIDAGKAEQQVEQNAAQAKVNKEAQDVENDVNSLSDADLERMRNKWTRPD